MDGDEDGEYGNDWAPLSPGYNSPGDTDELGSLGTLADDNELLDYADFVSEV